MYYDGVRWVAPTDSQKRRRNTMITKVRQIRMTGNDGRTENYFHIYYGKTVKWWVEEGKLPMTAVKFILSDRVTATDYYIGNTKRTEYIPA